MASTRPVGVGSRITVSGNKLTFDPPISGNGLTAYTDADKILNVDRTENKEITDGTVILDTVDRNKIVSVEVSPIGTWVTGDRVFLMKDTGTTTHGTISSANSVAVAGDIITVSFRNIQGDREVRIAGFITVSKDITIETDIIGERNIIVENRSDFIRPTSPCTIRDFVIANAQAAFRPSNSTGEVVIERCVVIGSDNAINKEGAGTVRVKNCIAVFCNSDGFKNANTASGAVKYENCAALYGNAVGFTRPGVSSTTATCNNCVSYRNLSSYTGVINGDNNVSSNAGVPTGTGNLINQTLDQVRPAFDFITGQPTDWRFLDGGNSVLEDGGKVIAGLTLDIDGRTRDGTTPNIGPTEDFTQFGLPTIGRQIRARHHNV